MKQKSGSSSSSASFSSSAGASLRKTKLSLALTYHKALSPWFWLNVVPFVLGYAAVLTAYFLHMDEDKDALWLLGLPVLFVLHVLSFLAMHWSVNARCFFAYRKVSDVKKADFVRVTPPAAHKGPTMLCALHRQDESEEGERLWFIYQQRTFVFDQGEGRFRKLDFPVSGQLEVYQSVKGHTTAGDLHRAQRKWQQNDFQIPLPSFAELFKEQALAPFFVFQVFCVCLWFFDAYWYFSLLTLVMLVVFESSVVQTRIQNLKVLREMAEMAKPKQNMFVYREGKWTQVSAKELLPGDICSLVRLNDETICPCDVLLLSGSCVVDEAMLTGESTPQLKESIQYRNGDENFNISNSNDHIHVIFGGTTIVQASAVSKTEENYRLRAPDGGCIVYVLRTGFYTSQGKLMRTIMFSSERVTANTLETFLFIGCLLCFAIAASGYVLYKGLQDESRSRWKLFLECALVITSVVPPELPTELSLAVNTSLVALRRIGIFCTEPFRIPFAGKVQICCFDKTGTLTSDKLILEGVAGLDDPLALKDPKELDWEQTLAIAGCHSLVYLNGKQVGDPMEVAALEGINWSYTKGEVSVGRSHGRPGQVRIVRRFHFTSELKRMATVVSLDHESTSTLMATAKGAPETMQPFFTEVPSHYTQTYKHYSRKGFRVIAVGYKPMSYVNASKLNAIPREEIECDLTFAGFLVFKSILKKESLVTMRALIQASHMVTMITGDNTLTACQVATELDILKKPVLILTIQQESGKEKAYWVSVDETVRLPFEGAKGRMLPLPMSKKALQQLRKNNGLENAEEVIAKAEDGYELCLSGQALDWLQQTNRPVREWKQLVPQVSVWARVSPQHKQLIVAKLKSFGYITLMCGDGTNDVGALKQAHVGVALLTSSNEGSSKTKTSGEGAASASSSDRSTTSKSAKAGPSASLKQVLFSVHICSLCSLLFTSLIS
ncbi:Cation-transporting ATPase [Balamuthia mandrillaris]